MRILVTGGTGFIASHLIRRLMHDRHDIITNGTSGEQAPPPVRIYFPTDFTQLTPNNVGRIDMLFHQAAINDTTSRDSCELFRINVTASLKLFNDVISMGCKRIVYASSTAVYGNAPAPFTENKPCYPLNPYGASKLALDEHAMIWARDHPAVVIVGLRYCNVYGPHENHKGKRASMIYQLAHQMLAGNPTLFKFGQHRRDFIYIDDVVNANLCAAKAPESCVVNCGNGTATSFNEIVELLNKTLGTQRTPLYVDNPYEAMYQNHTECDMRLAREKIGFVPHVSIEEGIRKYHASKWLTQ